MRLPFHYRREGLASDLVKAAGVMVVQMLSALSSGNRSMQSHSVSGAFCFHCCTLQWCFSQFHGSAY
jgi:hypothetical protein